MTPGFHHIRLKKTAGGGSVFDISIKGKLSRQDYCELIPQLEWQIAKAGKISLLIDLRNFHGWTLRAFWEDLKFSAKHFDDIEKIALVGAGRPWERGLTSLYKPFTRAEVRFFKPDEKIEAENWMMPPASVR